MSSLSDFIRSSLSPIGSTLYVFGGGWNTEDVGSGITATQIGLYPCWQAFFNQYATPDYDFNQYRYRTMDGLDCSGFVGWAVYQALPNRKEGYVYSASDQAAYFEKLGLGEILKEPRDHFASVGDVVSIDGHVYLVLGEYPDKSILFVHASPPALHICGTEFNGSSEASDAAKRLMESFYPDLTDIFPYRGRDHEKYIKNATVFRFYEDILPDVDHLREMDMETRLNFILKK